MADKMAVMVLKVDLQCPCCYKKVKKILCKFPQIRDQVYDEIANKVTITVLCCNPEKLREKLCCKGAKVITSIEIQEPPKPKQPEKPKEPEKPKDPEKPKQPEKPNIFVNEKPKEPEKPKVVIMEKPKEPEKPKEVEKPEEKPVEKPKEVLKPDLPKRPEPAPNPLPPEPVMRPIPVPVNEFPPAFPVRACCGECNGDYGGGPCYNGFGTLVPPPPCYDDYYAYGIGRGCHVSRCDYYFSDENPRGCYIM